MGGLAGHMSHLYGDKGLKLKELIKIVSSVASGDIKFNEKADGQNIFVTVTSDRKVFFARNKTDFKNIGRTTEQIKSHYAQKGLKSQVEIFGDGCSVIEKVLDTLSDETFNLVFNDEKMTGTYINCEIIHKSHPNLVLYETNHIQFHELQVLGDVTYETIEGLNILNKKFEKLLSEVSGQEVNIDGVSGESLKFTADGPRFLPSVTEMLSGENLNLFEQQSDETITMLNSLFSSVGLSNENTLGDYLIAKIEDEVLPALSIPKDLLSDISHYLIYGTDASGIKISSRGQQGNTLKTFKAKLAAVLPKELADKLTLGKYKTFQNGLAGAAIGPIKEIIHKFSLSIVNNAESVIASDPGLAKYATQQALSDMDGLKKAMIQDYQDVPDRLEKNLTKFERELTLLGDVKNFSQSMEGVVINYVREDGMPMLYKLTGNFAPANQLLGMSKQGFEIKRSLLSKAREEYKNTPYTPTPEDDENPVNETKLKSIIRKTLLRHISAFSRL